MSSWVSVDRIKKQSFFKMNEFLIINYHEIKENVLPENEGMEELGEYPSINELRRYVPRLVGENKDVYYERALSELVVKKRSLPYIQWHCDCHFSGTNLFGKPY